MPVHRQGRARLPAAGSISLARSPAESAKPTRRLQRRLRHGLLISRLRAWRRGRSWRTYAAHLCSDCIGPEHATFPPCTQVIHALTLVSDALHSNLASNLICALRTFEMGQLFTACQAMVSKVSLVRFGTFARNVNAEPLMR
jgi:hypothetical protein